MKIYIYKNRIASPNKCGTRFLSEIDDNTRTIINHYDIFKYDNFDAIVIRNPLEHFKSALHTEVLNISNVNYNEDYTHLINSYLTPIGSAHWSYELYEVIYQYYTTKKDLSIIRLQDLSYAIFEKNTFNPENYSFQNQFNNWKSKDEVFENFLKLFPNEMSLIMKKINQYEKFYTYLENKSINFHKKGII